MAINEWRLWKKMGLIKEGPEEEVKVKDDLNAVIAFLREIEVKDLILHLERMKGLVREEGIVESKLKKENLQKQIKYFDAVLEKYEFFQTDADINGLRLKKIAGELLKKAKEKKISRLVKEKKKDLKWR